MAYQSLEIHGFRGFAQPAALNLALPNGRAGSGITVLLGPNNGGKSTIIEAFSALTQPHPPPTFSEGKRNTAAGSRVTIRYTPAEGEIFTLSSVDMSVTSWSTPPPGNPVSVVMVPSRRSFSPYFPRQLSAHLRHVIVQNPDDSLKTKVEQHVSYGPHVRCSTDPPTKERPSDLHSKLLSHGPIGSDVVLAFH